MHSRTALSPCDRNKSRLAILIKALAGISMFYYSLGLKVCRKHLPRILLLQLLAGGYADWPGNFVVDLAQIICLPSPFSAIGLSQAGISVKLFERTVCFVG